MPDDGVRTNLELLLRYTQLTATDKSYEINLRDAILNGHVVYFYTPAMGELQCSRAISGLALYTLINAAMELDEEGTPFNRPHVFIDEWQMLAGENIAAVLSLGRKLLSLYRECEG